MYQNDFDKRERRTSFEERRIDHWVTHQRVVNVINNDGKLPLKLGVIIEHPEFTNGERGFSRVSMTIGVGNYYVRLATKATITLLDLLAEHRGSILDAVDKVYELNHEMKKEQEQQQDKRRRSKDIPVAKEDYPLLDNNSLNLRRKTSRTTRSRRPSYSDRDKER